MSDDLPPFLRLFEQQAPNTIGIVCPVCGGHEVAAIDALSHPYPNGAPDDWPRSAEIVMYCDACVDYFSLHVRNAPLLSQAGEDLSAGPCSDKAREREREREARGEGTP